MGLSYTNVNDVETAVPGIESATSITSATIINFGERVEGVMNSMLARRYAVPVSSEGGALRSIATDLTAYQILSQRMLSRLRLSETAWPNIRDAALERLKEIARGDMALVDTAGAQIAARDSDEAWSNTEDYVPTFSSVLDLNQSRVDEDREDDELDARN